MVRKVIEENLISIPEVKEILDNVVERLKKMDKKVDPFLEATNDYAHTFAKMSVDAAKKIIKMLIKDYGMELTQAIQVVNIDPSYPQEIKVILEKDQKLRSLPEDQLTIMIQKIKDLQA